MGVPAFVFLSAPLTFAVDQTLGAERLLVTVCADVEYLAGSVKRPIDVSRFAGVP